MKALVLAGGTGSRLRPLTFTRAKQLLPVANEPTLYYGLKAIVDAGITEIGIIIGDTGADIKKVVGDGSQWGVRITYIPQSAPLGLAHAVKTAHEYLGDDDFVMYLGDNILRDGIKGFVDDFKRTKPDALVLLTPVDKPELFGNAEIAGDGHIIKLVEKPKHPKSNLALVGVYLFTTKVFEAIDNINPSWRNELEITDAIQWLIENQCTVKAYQVTGWWKDTGNAEDLINANQLILERIVGQIDGDVDNLSKVTGNVRIAAGARIENSILRGPLVIGSDTVIKDAFIGPFTSVGNKVRIERAELENSIISDGCVLQDLPYRISDSLLGEEVKLECNDRVPKVYRFVLGDKSEVMLNR